MSESLVVRNRILAEGGGVCFGDVDRDGMADIFLARTEGPNASPRTRHSPISRRATSQMFSLTTSRWHYIRNGDGAEELYDWEYDPSESVDLAAQPVAEPVLRSLRRRLQALLQEQ